MKLETPSRMMPAITTSAIAVLGILWLAACGGSGDGGGPTPPSGPSPMILFTPDRAAGARSITLREGSDTTASILQLEVFATEVPGIQAVDFLLLFPNDLLRFESFDRGELIGAGAQVVLASAGSNTLAFQILRIAQTTAPETGLILTLTFTAIGAGSDRIDFVNPEAEDIFGATIPDIDWIGGTVQVVL